MTDDSLAIHRLLDEAFAGIDMTPEARDLKEEMRANLVARMAELERSGVSRDVCAQRAMAELGDIRSIVTEAAATPSAPAWLDQRVRPRPAYVIRTLLLSLPAAAALAVLAWSVLDTAVAGWQPLAVAVLAVAGGVIVADALRQETTTSYPLPVGRALGYGAATTTGLAGAGCVAAAYPQWPVGLLVAAGVLLIAAAVAFTYLGVTQTNRHKPWVVRMQREHQEIGDVFAGDPAAAARFGIYTAAIWLAALGGFVVLTFTVGWAWSWLALLGGLLAMLLIMARTMFRPHGSDPHSPAQR
ncbi:permease prefix domain 1-containing protein [Catellatospora paridis]|uniref:permease prefix domain 1-containing protein n=1 Tax=Catellatospora paridis TaxID=1617086 RepID=UPI0012D43B60|nr:permease prefix domain 1-containing protein [Catellatospora paridis]